MPKEPLLFLKPPSSVIRNGESIVIPHNVDEVHYEGEIGVMIGSTGRYISAENAWSVIGGIMAVNDVTARKIQRDENQWFRGKGFDTFCPVGEGISVMNQNTLVVLSLRSLPIHNSFFCKQLMMFHPENHF